MSDKIGGTCGTCKFKGNPVKAYPVVPVQGVKYELCDTKFFICRRIEFDANGEFKAGSKAIVKDGSGYYGALCVENDFGCILWVTE